MGKKAIVFFVVLISLPVLLSAYSLPVAESLRLTFFSVSKPVLSAGSQIQHAYTTAADYAKELLFIFRKNRELRKKVEELEYKNSILQAEQIENQRLRDLLQVSEQHQHKSIAARVMVKDVTHFANWAALDKGRAEGVRKNQAVVSTQGLVGKIIEAGSRSSRVVFLTDIEARVSGLVERTRDTGLLMGDGTEILVMRYIDLESDIKVGDRILSAGLGKVYPKDILIGTVEAIGRDPEGFHLEARVRPAVKFSRLEEALCLDYPPHV